MDALSSTINDDRINRIGGYRGRARHEKGGVVHNRVVTRFNGVRSSQIEAGPVLQKPSQSTVSAAQMGPQNRRHTTT